MRQTITISTPGMTVDEVKQLRKELRGLAAYHAYRTPSGRGSRKEPSIGIFLDAIAKGELVTISVPGDQRIPLISWLRRMAGQAPTPDLAQKIAEQIECATLPPEQAK